MEISLVALAPLIGLAGVVAGALLNEFVRRRNRREAFAPKIFEKRLEAYEGLFEEIRQGSTVASEVIDRDDFTQEQRHELIGVVVHSIGRFVEMHKMYLDDDITVHCMALFMGVEDIHDAPEASKTELLRNYNSMRNAAINMIVEDSGVAEVSRLFKTINKPKIGGDLIEYYRDLKRRSSKRKR